MGLNQSPFYPSAHLPGCVKKPSGVESQRRIMSAEDQARFVRYTGIWQGNLPQPSFKWVEKPPYDFIPTGDWFLELSWRAAFRGGGE